MRVVPVNKMHTEKEFINDLWERSTGKKFPRPKKMPSLDELKKSEWCPEFELLMRNRMIMGAFRYDPIAEQDYNKYNLPAEIKKRTERYEKTKNLEHLIDAANLCLIAFIHGKRIGEK